MNQIKIPSDGNINFYVSNWICVWICRFCVGDRFYLCDNKILCENDYADRQMSLPMANQSITTNNNNNNTINNNNNNMNEYSANNHNMSKNAADHSRNMTMSPYSEKNNFANNFDVPIHVR